MKNSPDKKIFISYRVQDTAGETGRLVDALKQYFADDQLFMDIENLEPGADFTEAIERSLGDCDVFLAVIGPRWIGPREGLPNRISDAGDWVRLEVSTALRRNVRVVPVLVDSSTLPKPEDLPADLQPLLRRQTIEISNKRWRYDTDQLVLFLVNTIGITPKRHQLQKAKQAPAPVATRRKTILWAIGGFVLAVAVLAIIGSVMGEERSKDEATTSTTPMENTVMTEPPKPETAVATTSQPDISGTWVDANESEATVKYIIQQNGAELTAEVYGNGVLLTKGNGNIDNHHVKLDLNMMGMVLQGELSDDGTTISGTNSSANMSASEPVKLVRH